MTDPKPTEPVDPISLASGAESAALYAKLLPHFWALTMNTEHGEAGQALIVQLISHLEEKGDLEGRALFTRFLDLSAYMSVRWGRLGLMLGKLYAVSPEAALAGTVPPERPEGWLPTQFRMTPEEPLAGGEGDSSDEQTETDD